MKRKLLSLLLLAGLALPLGGCHDQIESDLGMLERRIERLEQRCEELNKTISGLQTLLDNLAKFDFITSIEPFYNNQGIAGYTISFTHSDPITLYNGLDAETPELGAALGEDGVWYWTVRYPSDLKASFITDNYGVRIPTSAASPVLKIENGNWMVTYDGGEIWHNLGRATGEDGASFFESVTEKDGYIEFKLLNGTIIQAPTWASFEKLQDNCRKTNENLAAFTRLAKQFTESLYLQEMVPILSGTDTIGHSLRLSDGSIYTFYDGTASNIPVIGAQRDTTGSATDIWYWTIQYGSNPAQWILDDKGRKIQANAPDGLTPTLSLKQVSGDPAWYWAVAYGTGEPSFLLFDGEKVQASAIAPEPAITSILTVQDDVVRLMLAGGLYCDIPLAKAIVVTLQAPVTSSNTLLMSAGETVSFRCLVAGADARTEVLPITDNTFYAVANPVDSNHSIWDITVKAPSPFSAPSSSRLNLLISNGTGQMKTVVITLLPRS